MSDTLRVKLDAPPKVAGLSGTGYPEADTGPLTDKERVALARRKALEPPDAGRRKPGKPNMRPGEAPDTMRSVGLDEYACGRCGVVHFTEPCDVPEEGP